MTTTDFPGARRADPPARSAPAETLLDADGRVYAGWQTTLASFVGMTFGPSSAIVFCFGVFAPALEREFGWSVGAVSFGATLISLCIIVVSLLSGYLVDRIGARRLVLASILPFGAAVAALSLLPSSLAVFYAALVAVMLVGAGATPVVYNKATAVWFDRRLGFSLGLTNVGIGVGAALLPALVGSVIGAYGWRTAYIVLGVLAVAIPWPIAYALLKEREAPLRGPAGPGPAAAPAPAASPTGGLSFAETRRTREYWLALGGFVVLGAASSTFVIHLVRILADTGMPVGKAVALQSALGMALIVGRVATGWLIDRMRAATVMVALCGVAALALVLLAAGAPGGSGVLCAMLGGFVVGAEFDVLGFLIPRYFGRRAFGVVYGAIFGAFQLASAFTIGMLGWWRGSHGSYTAGLYLIAGLLLIGVVCFQRLGVYRYAAGSAAH